MTVIATKDSWKNIPIVDPKKIKIELHFTESQFLKLIEGIIPVQMEDKWFVYYEDGWLYYHRSWTGHGIFKAYIEQQGAHYSIKEFWAERNLNNYNNDDDNTDIGTLITLIQLSLKGDNPNDIFLNNEYILKKDPVRLWSLFGNFLYKSKA